MLIVYIVGIMGMLRTDKLHIPTLQCLTCDDEQADDTKSLRLHLQEVILTTEQCRRILQMMQNIVLERQCLQCASRRGLIHSKGLKVCFLVSTHGVHATCCGTLCLWLWDFSDDYI